MSKTTLKTIIKITKIPPKAHFYSHTLTNLPLHQRKDQIPCKIMKIPNKIQQTNLPELTTVYHQI